MMKYDYHPLRDILFWRCYLIHMRPYLLFVSGSAGLVGIALGGAGHEVGIVTFLMAFIPCFLGYGFGQALTDTFQMDTDTISSPYRPLVQGLIAPNHVFWVSLLALILSSLSLLSLNFWNFPLLFLSIVGLITYTYFKKNYYALGPFYNGWIVMLLPLMGYLSLSKQSLVALFLFPPWPLMAILGVTLFAYAQFVLIGYLKDITADRETGYRTFPVVWGWDLTVLMGDLFLTMILILLFCSLSPWKNHWGLFLSLLGTLVAISGQLYAHLIHKKCEKNSAYPISSTVRSFILWMLALTVNYQSQWIYGCVLFYLLFELILFFRPQREQI